MPDMNEDAFWDVGSGGEDYGDGGSRGGGSDSRTSSRGAGNALGNDSRPRTRGSSARSDAPRAAAAAVAALPRASREASARSFATSSSGGRVLSGGSGARGPRSLEPLPPRSAWRSESSIAGASEMDRHGAGGDELGWSSPADELHHDSRPSRRRRASVDTDEDWRRQQQQQQQQQSMRRRESFGADSPAECSSLISGGGGGGRRSSTGHRPRYPPNPHCHDRHGPRRGSRHDVESPGCSSVGHAEQVEEVSQEWHLKDARTAEAMWRKQQRYKKIMNQASRRKKLSDPAERLKNFKKVSESTRDLERMYESKKHRPRRESYFDDDRRTAAEDMSRYVSAMGEPQESEKAAAVYAWIHDGVTARGESQASSVDQSGSPPRWQQQQQQQQQQSSARNRKQSAGSGGGAEYVSYTGEVQAREGAGRNDRGGAAGEPTLLFNPALLMRGDRTSSVPELPNIGQQQQQAMGDASAGDNYVDGTASAAYDAPSGGLGGGGGNWRNPADDHGEAVKFPLISAQRRHSPSGNVRRGASANSEDTSGSSTGTATGGGSGYNLYMQY